MNGRAGSGPAPPPCLPRALPDGASARPHRRRSAGGWRADGGPTADGDGQIRTGCRVARNSTGGAAREERPLVPVAPSNDEWWTTVDTADLDHGAVSLRAAHGVAMDDAPVPDGRGHHGGQPLCRCGDRWRAPALSARHSADGPADRKPGRSSKSQPIRTRRAAGITAPPGVRGSLSGCTRRGCPGCPGLRQLRRPAGARYGWEPVADARAPAWVPLGGRRSTTRAAGSGERGRPDSAGDRMVPIA